MSWNLQSPRMTPQIRQGGQILVILVISITGLLGMAGLVTDGSLAYVHRRQMQNAADAGSLAGTRILAAHYDSVCAFESSARTAAVAMAQANGVINASDVAVGLTDFTGAHQSTCSNATTMGMWVRVQQPYETYFSRVLGINTLAAGADASAGYAFIKAYSSNQQANGYGALPVVLNRDSVPANPGDGTQVILQPANYGGSTGTVNYGNIDPTQYGQPLPDALAHGLSITVVAGQGCASSATSPATACKAGGISATDPSVFSAIEGRIDSAPNETWSTFGSDSKRVVVLMIGNGDIGNATLLPIGFATVFIDRVTPNNLYVHFIRVTIPAAGATLDLGRTTNTSTSSSSLLSPPVIRLLN